MNFFESQALLYMRKAFKMKYLDVAFWSELKKTGCGKKKSPLTTVGLKHLKHLSDISRRKQANVVLSGAIN